MWSVHCTVFGLKWKVCSVECTIYSVEVQGELYCSPCVVNGV